jgi:acylphosphatase
VGAPLSSDDPPILARAGAPAGRVRAYADRVIRRHIVIRGFVQGVGFRYWLARAADARGVAGWVRNRADGRVEAVLEGDAVAVEELVRQVEAGPRGADVDGVEVSAEAAEGLRGFDIRG